MKILITGGTGFLGSHTALALKKLGHEVSVLARSIKDIKKFKSQNIAFYQCDITDGDKLDAIISRNEIIIHCAAIASPFGSYHSFKEINFEGTKNIVNSCIKHNIKRLINISTPSIYFDYTDKVGIKESDELPNKQVSHYGKTKLMADQFISKANKENNLVSISLRPRAIFGVGDQTITPRILDSKILGRSPLISSGKAMHDITYIDNVVDAIILALDSGPETFGKTYNITNGEPLAIGEVFRLFHKAFNKEYNTLNINYKLIYIVATISEFIYRIFNIKSEPKLTKLGVGLFGHSQTLNIDLAKKELGYEPRISISEGLQIVSNSKRS